MSPEPPPRPGRPARRYAVLVAEDDPLVLALVRASLRSLEVDLLEADNGRAALALARDRSPDLLLLDVGLPGIDGLEVCRRLKGDPSTRGVRVVLLTARAQQSDRDAGAAAGADDYVAKPFSPATLASQVSGWLG